MNLQTLIDELRENELETQAINARLGAMNQEATALHSKLAALHALKARIVADLTSPHLEVV